MRVASVSLLYFLVLATSWVNAQEPKQREAAAKRWGKEGSGGVPEFGRHILPLVGKLGCSNRACHGSFQGQNGFRLSLFGSDPAADHKALTEDQNGEGSRVNVKDPDERLALYKPTHGDEHGGGERMKTGGWESRMLREWIKAGAPFRPEKEVHVTQLTMTPAEIVLAKGQKPVHLQVLANFSDGTMEDVTCLTTFESRDESVATISESGEISAQRPGDTAIVATFGPVVTSSQVLVPRPGEIVATSKEWSLNPVDELVREKLRKLNLRPSEVASDAVFLRRAYLDVIGTLPTPNKVREFLADSRPDKRAKLFDQLLDRPEYAKYSMCKRTSGIKGWLGRKLRPPKSFCIRENWGCAMFPAQVQGPSFSQQTLDL